MRDLAEKPGFIATIQADLGQFAIYSAGLMRQRTGLVRSLSMLLTPTMMCCLLHRLAHACHQRDLSVLARLVALLNLIIHKIDIDPAAAIGPGLYIPHPAGVVFHACAGPRLTLYSRAVVVPRGFGRGQTAAPQLGAEVTVGANAVVSGAVLIGDRAFVGAGSTIAKNVPAAAYVLDRPQQRLSKKPASPEVSTGKAG